LIEELKDLYNAENQLVKALPKMAKGASSPDLKELIITHLGETKGQVERLKQVFEQLEEKPTGKVCKGMQGLIEEGEEQLESDEEGATKDVGITGAALRVEHYEIAGYTAAIAIAQELGHDEIVSLLTENLEEEQAASEKVQAQAESLIGEASSDSENDDDSEEADDEAVTTGGRARSSSNSSRTKRSTRKWVRHRDQRDI
jgi:ferritin-like metal-binding protein YciE